MSAQSMASNFVAEISYNASVMDSNAMDITTVGTFLTKPTVKVMSLLQSLFYMTRIKLNSK